MIVTYWTTAQQVRSIKVFANRGQIRVLNGKTIDLFYSRPIQKLKFLMRNLLTTFVEPAPLPPGQNSNSSDRTKTSGDLLTDTRFDLSPQYHDPKLELE